MCPRWRAPTDADGLQLRRCPTRLPSRGPALRTARFADLTPFEVYALCRLRVDVFVVEQECPYPELDGRDVEPATVHLWAEVDGEVAATIRVLDDGATRAIGRVATRRPTAAAGWRPG